MPQGGMDRIAIPGLSSHRPEQIILANDVSNPKRKMISFLGRQRRVSKQSETFEATC